MIFVFENQCSSNEGAKRESNKKTSVDVLGVGTTCVGHM
jgi:hypothetical protein